MAHLTIVRAGVTGLAEGRGLRRPKRRVGHDLRSIINVALPTIQRSLGFTAVSVEESSHPRTTPG